MEFEITYHNPIPKDLLNSIKRYGWYIKPTIVWTAEEITKSGLKPPHIAGYSGASLFDAETLYMGPTFVESHYRGMGLQQKFIKVKTDYARGICLKRLIGYVDYENIWSANNLISSGFKLLSHKDKWLYFEKVL